MVWAYVQSSMVNSSIVNNAPLSLSLSLYIYIYIYIYIAKTRFGTREGKKINFLIFGKYKMKSNIIKNLKKFTCF